MGLAAYDFDEGVTNSIYEYNYSHDNGGAAILVYNPGGGNVFRYNVSENDNNQMLGGSGVYAIGIPGGSLSIYNNTIYRSGVFSRATPSCYTFGAPPSAVYPTGIVLANNFLQLFIFWELVGVSSYLLIGFWFERPAAADAGKKAFEIISGEFVTADEGTGVVRRRKGIDRAPTQTWTRNPAAQRRGDAYRRRPPLGRSADRSR